MTPTSKEKAWILQERIKEIIGNQNTDANLCAQLMVEEILAALNGRPLAEVGYWAKVLIELSSGDLQEILISERDVNSID